MALVPISLTCKCVFQFLGLGVISLVLKPCWQKEEIVWNEMSQTSLLRMGEKWSLYILWIRIKKKLWQKVEWKKKKKNFLWVCAQVNKKRKRRGKWKKKEIFRICLSKIDTLHNCLVSLMDIGVKTVQFWMTSCRLESLKRTSSNINYYEKEAYCHFA